MSGTGEFYVVACEGMAPVEAIGPFEEREVAAKVVSILKLTRLRFPLTIATRRPVGIPVMPAAMFVAEFEAAMQRGRAKAKASTAARPEPPPAPEPTEQQLRDMARLDSGGETRGDR